MPAEQVGLELFAQHVTAEILDGAGLAVGAVMKDRVEPVAGACEDLRDSGLDRVAVIQVELQAFQALGDESFDVGRFAGGCKHAPAAFVQAMCNTVADAR